MKKILLIAVLLLPMLGACSTSELTQQIPTTAEAEVGQKVARAIAGKSFVGQWGSGDFIVDIETTPGSDFVFNPSGGGQSVSMREDGGAKLLKYKMKVISMRVDGNTLILVTKGSSSAIFTTYFHVNTAGGVGGNISAYNLAQGMSWDSTIKEGKIPE